MAQYNGPTGVGPTVLNSVYASKLVIDMSDIIAFLEPSAAPFLRFLTPSNDPKATLRKQACFDPKFEWLEDEGVSRWAQINAGNLLYTDTTLTVDDSTMIGAGWKIVVPRTGEVMRVTSVTNSTTIVVVRGAEAVSAAWALVDDDPLLVIGNTSAEGSGVPLIITSVETAKYNYTEIVKHPFGVTNTMRATKTYGQQNELEGQRVKKGIEHAIALEHRLLFGRRGIVGTGSDAQATRYTNGIYPQITTNVTVDTGSLTETEFNTWLQTFFQYGSEQKIVLCGSSLINALNSLVSGKIRINDVLTKKYGVSITEWISPYGTCYLVYDKLLTGATYAKYGIGCDLANLTYKYLNTRDTHLETDVGTNGADSYTEQYLTEAGLEVRLEKTHAILKVA